MSQPTISQPPAMTDEQLDEMMRLYKEAQKDPQFGAWASAGKVFSKSLRRVTSLEMSLAREQKKLELAKKAKTDARAKLTDQTQAILKELMI